MILAFLLGVILGAGAMVPVAGHQIQRLRIERDEWAYQAHERKAEMDRLKDGLKELSDISQCNQVLLKPITRVNLNATSRKSRFL